MVDLMKNKDDAFGQITASPQQLQEEISESRVFFTILYHCALVLGGPIVAFFGTKLVLLSPVFQWEAKEVKTDVTSAVVAIVVLHAALFFYIFNAYFQDKKAKIGKKD